MTSSTNGSFGASQQLNQTSQTPSPPAPLFPGGLRVCVCGSTVTESDQLCKSCFNQINESTTKPLLLD